MENQTPKKIESLDLPPSKRYTLFKIVDGEPVFQENGHILWPLVVGRSFRIGTTSQWWSTSMVQEIERTGKGAKFLTLNSEYLVEEV